jgi:hypothetical protein
VLVSFNEAVIIGDPLQAKKFLLEKLYKRACNFPKFIFACAESLTEPSCQQRSHGNRLNLTAHRSNVLQANYIRTARWFLQ